MADVEGMSRLARLAERKFSEVEDLLAALMREREEEEQIEPPDELVDAINVLATYIRTGEV